MTNREKQSIYLEACNVLKSEYRTKFTYSTIFDGDFSFNKEDDTSINEIIYDIDFFKNRFDINEEEAINLINSLIKNEKLEQIDTKKYISVRKCSLCGKKFDKYDALGNNTICHNFGDGSKYDKQTLDIDLCNSCYDNLAEYLLLKMRKPKLIHESNLHLYSSNESKDELKNKYKLSEDEIDDVIPF